MRRLLIVCLVIFWGGMFHFLPAQVKIEQDSVKRESSNVSVHDRTISKGDKKRSSERRSPLVVEQSDTVRVTVQDSVVNLVMPFKPSPTKAVLYSLVPGLGQIYNRKYWKLPIVYGGFIGLTYAISWNGKMYNDYQRAYIDIATGRGNSWQDFIKDPNERNKVINDPSTRKRREDQFKRNRDNFRRNRDLAIICTVGFYALCMIDAYVDAQLYDFDVSPDLSMRVAPMMFEPTSYSGRSFGVQCSIYF